MKEPKVKLAILISVVTLLIEMILNFTVPTQEANGYPARNVHSSDALFAHTKILERWEPQKVRIASWKIAAKLISRYLDGDAWVHGSRLEAVFKIECAGTYRLNELNLFLIDVNIWLVPCNLFQLHFTALSKTFQEQERTNKINKKLRREYLFVSMILLNALKIIT